MSNRETTRLMNYDLTLFAENNRKSYDVCKKHAEANNKAWQSWIGVVLVMIQHYRREFPHLNVILSDDFSFDQACKELQASFMSE